MSYFPYLFLNDRFQNFFRHYCCPRHHDPHALFPRPPPMRPGSQWIRSRRGADEILASPISKTTCRRKVLYVQRSKHFGLLLTIYLSYFSFCCFFYDYSCFSSYIFCHFHCFSPPECFRIQSLRIQQVLIHCPRCQMIVH